MTSTLRTLTLAGTAALSLALALPAASAFADGVYPNIPGDFTHIVNQAAASAPSAIPLAKGHSAVTRLAAMGEAARLTTDESRPVHPLPRAVYP